MLRSTKLSRNDHQDGWRLACQSTVTEDVTLWVPESAAAFKNDIRTADLSSPEDLARYQQQLRRLFDSLSSAPSSALSALTSYGIAVDIGTTTVTAALLDLKDGRVLAKGSLGNAQIRYGADVINRIIQSVKPGGREKLQGAIINETLLPLFEKMLTDAHLTCMDISRIVISGNTTMEHLLIGADANTIRLEPYEPEFLELTGKTIGDLFNPACAKPTNISLPMKDLPVRSDAPLILAPNVGSYVGGDITAGVLASGIWQDPSLSLFIDLGTNGELVLGNSEFMLCCACSAGPAFEGGDISCGMRATTGAIDDVVLDPETLEPTLSIIGRDEDPAIIPLGLCGSGLIACISELFRVGAIDARGKFIREDPRIQREEYGLYSFMLAPGIELDEADIDNFIRAKAALFSAIRTMLDSLDMTVSDIDKIILSGGIGSGIDIEKAISIGMLPKVPLDKYSYIGNSSLTGSCAMLLSDDAVDKVFSLGRSMTYLELSSHPGYMEAFVAACFLPHTDGTLFA